jgi:hypothetical protein
MSKDRARSSVLSGQPCWKICVPLWVAIVGISFGSPPR